MHTENIQVTAEAYDIALDITPGRNGSVQIFCLKVKVNLAFTVILLRQGEFTHHLLAVR